MNQLLVPIVSVILVFLGGAFTHQNEPLFGAPSTQLSYQATLIPLSDAAYDIGTSTQAWRTGYFTQLCLTADTCKTAWPTSGGSLSGGTAGMITAWTSSSAVTATSGPTASFFYATSTTASRLPYASTTAASAQFFCLTGDNCISAWPTGSGGAYPFTPALTFSTTTSATTSSIWTKGVFFSSSTVAASQFPYASSTALSSGVLTLSTPLGTASGGTGLSNPGSPSTEAILTFAGTGGATAIGATLSNGVMISNGTGWQIGTVALASANAVSGTLPIANGGTNLTTYTAGDILYASRPTTLAKIASTTSGTVLALLNGIPTWVATTTLSTITGTLPVSNGGTGATTLTGLTLGNGTSAFTAYAGTSCTNQFVRSLNGSGVATCATVANTDLTNSSVTINTTGIATGGGAVSLGSTLTINASSSPTLGYFTATTTTATSTILGNLLISTSTGFYNLPNNPLLIGGSVASVVQSVIWNKSLSSNASASFVANTDKSNNNAYYTELGQNSSAFSQSSENAQNGGDSYLVASDGALVISTASSTNSLADMRFTTGGTASTSIRMTIRQANGYVGISTSTPWGLLSINPNGLTSGAPAFTVGSTSATYFLINNGGKIGVSSSTPTARASIEMGNSFPSSFIVSNQGSTTPAFNILGVNGNGRAGFGTSTPWGALSVQSPGSNYPSFVVGSSTKAQFQVTADGFTAVAGSLFGSLGEPATSTTQIIDWAKTANTITLWISTSATTITFINATTSNMYGSRKLIEILNPNGTAGALTWSNAHFGSTAPTQTTTANTGDAYSCYVGFATSSPLTAPTYKVRCGQSITGIQ